MSADWAKNCIWWHVYPLGFTGAPIRQEHDEKSRLLMLINWLDYAVELGTSGLLLGPIFTSETHGYDSVDQFEIDPRLGTLADFDALVAACKERGLRIVLDGVFNHFGAGHPWVQAALSQGPQGPEADFFRLDWSNQESPKIHSFEGHESLVTLNHENVRVEQYVVDAMNTWLERGIDGWRLDAAYAVPTSFWAKVLPKVRETYPDAWILGEVIHGDYGKIAIESTMDSITQYELWKALWSSLKDRNYWELDAALERHNDFLDDELPNTFVGNHDVTRIASMVGPDAAILAFVVLMTVGGTPSIYYGDEQAYTGMKEERWGGDDDIRPSMPLSPSELSHFGWPTHQLHRELIALRRRNPWLSTARTQKLHLTNETYSYAVRGLDDSVGMIVNLDLTSGFHAEVQAENGEVLFKYSRASIG